MTSDDIPYSLCSSVLFQSVMSVLACTLSCQGGAVLGISFTLGSNNIQVLASV